MIQQISTLPSIEKKRLLPFAPASNIPKKMRVGWSPVPMPRISSVVRKVRLWKKMEVSNGPHKKHGQIWEMEETESKEGGGVWTSPLGQSCV